MTTVRQKASIQRGRGREKDGSAMTSAPTADLLSVEHHFFFLPTEGLETRNAESEHQHDARLQAVD